MADEIDTALKAFDHARAEIIERMKMRETAMLAHVTAAFTLGGVYFGFAVHNASVTSLPFLVPLSLLFPLLSLVFAQIVSQHMVTIDHLAGFIRTRLDAFLRANDAWAPHWDEHTDLGDAEVQRQKSEKAFWKHILVLHAPTAALSFAALIAVYTKVEPLHRAVAALWQCTPQRVAEHFAADPEMLWFFLGSAISIGLYIVAVRITWDSFAVRRQAGGSGGPRGTESRLGDVTNGETLDGG